MGEPYLRGAVMPGRSACTRCHAPLRWLATRHGKKMPIDPQPSTERDANVVIAADGVAEVLGPMDPRWATSVARYRCHFKTCPNAGEFRRRGSKRRVA